ncbi:MAG: DUF3800 domain-containing protein [Patescibacteria group bacterium]
MRNLCLFIDESGIANPKVTNSEVYILAGCMVDDYAREKLKIEADQIKFKYWTKTNIVFHSKEIGRKEGDFKIFKMHPETGQKKKKYYSQIDSFKIIP